MLDAARSVREITSGVPLAEYLQNRLIYRAVERELEIIGEAARRVSDIFKEAHPEIPWRKIVGQRNVLAHEYGDIKQERIWAVATTNLPDLIEQLEPLLPPAPSDQ